MMTSFLGRLVRLVGSDGTSISDANPLPVQVIGENMSYLTWSFHVPEALAANLNLRWLVPVSCHVTHISAVASNDSDATMTFGISTDTDSILASTVIGDSGVPVEFESGDWAVTNEEAALVNGQIAVLIVDYDGSAGTAAADLTIIITATVD
jgi:hypothetical protein